MKTGINPTWWTIVLAATAVLGTLATACMMPFVAVVTIAAATLRREQAMLAVTGAWAANQLLGFGLLGYPLDGHAIGWGVALGAASLAMVQVVAWIIDGGAARLVLAFGAAFIGYEALLFGFAILAGGRETFTPAIVVALFANEAIWFVVLSAVQVIATRGAPRLFGRAPIVRLG